MYILYSLLSLPFESTKLLLVFLLRLAYPGQANRSADELLAELESAVEIPVWGRPHSYNAATAACMAMYEYCRQFPAG